MTLTMNRPDDERHRGEDANCRPGHLAAPLTLLTLSTLLTGDYVGPQSPGKPGSQRGSASPEVPDGRAGNAIEASAPPAHPLGHDEIS